MSSGRPEILFPLFADPSALPGVGPRLAKLYEKLGATRVRDILFTPPANLVDRRLRASVSGATEGEVITVEVEINAHPPPPPGRKNAPHRVMVRDAQVDFVLIFFHAKPDWLTRSLPIGQRRVVSGRVEFFDGIAQMPHPDHILSPGEAAQLPPFEPVYPLTAGLSAKLAARVAKAALARAPELPEWLDPEFKRRREWPDWRAALADLHAPQGREELDPRSPTRARLAYDELLSHQLALTLARARMKRGKGEPTIGDGALRSRALAAAPFTPTGAQTRAGAEIAADMASGSRMLRLLQGDVGSGKTLVAMLAMLTAVEAGGQGAMMAPTEILARQHAQSIGPLAEAAGVRVAVLTGRDRGKPRERILGAVAAGEVGILIGTHALFQKDVEFSDLRLAVIDEQHRFGVAQRMELASKGRFGADILVMTATPIPRTLALASYGDMDISALDEKPPGRKPVETRLIALERYDEVVGAIRRAVDNERRVYWVCPLIEESEVSDLAAAEERARVLAQVLGAGRVGLIHGRMSGPEKDAAMAAFQAGQSRVLVATTVIEVGVDVPEATVMVIEQAERFGLAQLHQLRGRVGRGTETSSCLLLYQGPLGETARARLKILRETEDGFRIAEEDMRLRGAGDVLGVRQSGLPAFRIADLDLHGDLLQIAQDDARLIMMREPMLDGARGPALRALLYLMDRDAAIRYLSSG